MIGRGGCLSGLLVAGVLAGGAATGIPAAIKSVLDPPAPRAVRVVAVIDADTLLVKSAARAQRVRLLGVEAPEQGSCGGPLATAGTRGWVTRGGCKAKLTADRLAPARDGRGRLLANLSNSGGDLARWLVGRGLARTVSFRHRPLASHPRLLALEGTARARRKGLWSKCPRWARKHAVPFTSLPAGRDALRAGRRPPVELPMVGVLAARGAVR